MLNKFLRLLFFSFFSFTALAQSPSLRVIRINAENYCLGNELSIDVDVTGSFPTDNKFTVVAYRNWNDPKSRWEYPAELRGDKLITVLKEPSLANASTFAIRILTSNPQQEIAAAYTYKALTKPSVHLTSRWGFSADTINSTDKVTLALMTRPSSPGTVILSSGDTLNLLYADWTDGFATPVTLPKITEGIYTIKEASNVCGPMTTSGQVNIKINAIDFMPVGVSPEQQCEGGEIKVRFSTSDKEFNANTKFRIRFAGDNGYFNSYNYVDVPAVLTGKNELTARVPDIYESAITRYQFYIGIVAENPTAISFNKSLTMRIAAKPSFKLKADKSTINLGESIIISTNPTGISPFKFTLQSGETLSYQAEVIPEKSTSYQVKTFESGCRILENPPHVPLSVTVRPSLLSGNPSGTSTSKLYCEGQTVRLPFSSIGTSTRTTFAVEASMLNNKKISFPAKLVGDSLEFVISNNTSQDPDLDYGLVSGVRVVSVNPSLTSPYVPIKFQSRPAIIMTDFSPKNVPIPSVIRTFYQLLGGGPFTVELKDGTKQTLQDRDISFQQLVRKDTIFQLARLTNSCFSNSQLPQFPLQVLDPNSITPSLSARLIKKNYCVGDSVEIELNITGKFESDNQFTLSYLRNAQITTYPIQHITKPGTIKIKIPDLPTGIYDVSIQLSSSSPRLVSETERFTFGYPPGTPGINNAGTKENPVNLYLGSNPGAVLYAAPFSPVKFSVDGIDGEGVTNHNGNYYHPLTLKNQKLSEFIIKSVTNSCGTWNGEVASYYYGIGYKIKIYQKPYSQWHCVGSEAEVYYSFESGQAEPGTQFTLQISPTGSPGSYTDIAAVSNSSVIKFTTPDLKAGSYYIRIYSSDHIYSETSSVKIGHQPSARITTGYPGDSTAMVDYGSKIPLRTILTGNEPFGIMYSDGQVQSTNSNQDSYYPVATDPQTFTISKVWNSCGFGNTSGHVRVITKPILELSKFPANLDPTFCPGQKVELNYEVKGVTLSSKEYVSFYLRNSAWDIIKLDSVSRNSGKIQLTIPANLPGEYFTIIAKVTAFKIEKAVGYQLYATPDMTLAGDNTITAGETSTLLVRANSNFAVNSIFELSDGTSFKVTAPFPGGITEVKVTPGSSTTYTLKTAETVCGMSKVSGSATLTVLPKLAQWLSFERIEGLRRPSICNSDTVNIRFYHFGSSGGEQLYEVQLSDSTGNNFTSIPTFSNQYSYLNAVIPAGIRGSEFYRIRIASKDPKVSGSTYANRLKISEPASAKVVTPSVYYQPGQPVEAVIKLEGSSPFSYNFGDSNFSQNRYTRQFSDTIRLTPVSPMAVYKILQLSNECGVGKINDPSSFTVELITGIEALTERIKFGPNPTRNTLLVQFDNHESRNIEIFDLAGKKIFTKKYTDKEAQIDLTAYPTGIYLLKIRKKQAEVTYRVMKY